MSDITHQLQADVLQAIDTKNSVTIKAGGSKDFYGRCKREPTLLNVAQHQGIISYEPTELVIKARAGTPLREIETLLTENKQMLAFEPPYFADTATVGGTIACNLSGARRAYTGAVRDYILGTTIINGKAEVLSFGGEVMKNVAGYDVSRLMVGAMGTLGIILEASIKVVPMPEAEITIVQNISVDKALIQLHHWAALPFPISASCYYQGMLYIRLSGAEKAIHAAKLVMGGEVLTEAEVFWLSIKEQTHPFFNSDKSLWRLSLASNTPVLAEGKDMLYEWGGALRWFTQSLSETTVRESMSSVKGSLTLFRCLDGRNEVFSPLPTPLLAVHQHLKQAFDPDGIFNRGRMYQEF